MSEERVEDVVSQDTPTDTVKTRLFSSVGLVVKETLILEIAVAWETATGPHE